MVQIVADHSGASFTFAGDVKKPNLDKVFKTLRDEIAASKFKIPCISKGKALQLTKRKIDTVRDEMLAGTRRDLSCEYQGSYLLNRVSIAAQDGDLFIVHAEGDTRDLDIGIELAENGYKADEEGINLGDT